MFLVTGATGGLGRRIVRVLRQQGRPVRAFVRLTSRYSELENRGAEIFIGDLRQERDIEKACRGVRYIISAHGGSDAQALDYRANIDLIDQAKAVGVEHFVFISVLGSDRGYEDAPVFKAKAAVEKYLRSSGLTYTILRPSGLSSSLLPLAERFRQTGVYFLIGDPQIRSSIVSSDDLAEIAVASVQMEGARNQILPICGPEVLERTKIPQILGRIFNREPFVVNVPLLAVDGLRGAIALVNPDINRALGTFRTLLSNEFFCSDTDVERIEGLFNHRMETLETFLRREFGEPDGV